MKLSFIIFYLKIKALFHIARTMKVEKKRGNNGKSHNMCVIPLETYGDVIAYDPAIGIVRLTVDPELLKRHFTAKQLEECDRLLLEQFKRRRGTV